MRIKYFLSYSAIIIPVVIFLILISQINCQKESESNIVEIINEENNWIRHTIDKNVNRDHGHSLSVADLNGDNREDVLIAMGERKNPQPSDGIYWYEAPDSPSKKSWQRYGLSDPKLPIRWSMATTTGDMDNDGDLDVVALSFNKSNVYLCINPVHQGGDIHAPWETIIVLESPIIHRDGERVELVDLDKDGYLDILFPRGKPPGVHIIFNPSGKIYQKWYYKIIGAHGGSDAHDVIPSDIDSDGDIDVIVASGDKEKYGDIFWFENHGNSPGNSQWERHKISRHSSNYGALQVSDVNMNGRPDIFATQAHGTPGKIMWFRNPGIPQKIWRDLIIDTHNFPHAGLAFDVDGDSQIEYWVPDASHDTTGRYGQRTGGIVYYKIKEINQNLWTKHQVAAPPEVGRQCRAVDIDGDSDLDVVSTAEHNAQNHSISLVWWENRLANE